MVEAPSISIIIPTYNSSRSLAQCLGSIRIQEYPQDRIEIIIVDGGSTDATLSIAAANGVETVLQNPLRTGEAGKAVGIDAAKGEIIALIDSDNILDGKDWLAQMVLPFENPDIFCSECYALTYRPSDSLIDRYCSLLGMNDPVHLFVGNYDRLSTITGKWTALPLSMQDKGAYFEVTLTDTHIPTMGANGCLIRKEVLQEVEYRPYYFDIDVIYQLVQKGRRKVGFVKKGIVHLYCPDLKTFARKQKRRIYDFLHYKRLGRRSYPHQKYFFGYLKFVASTVLVLPLVAQALLGYSKVHDRAWFVHPVACWVTLLTYGWATARSFFVTGELDRSNWTQ